MILQVPTTPSPPTRIISLVPSITELLFYLGLETETIGITKFCVHPESWFKTKTRVGGTKSIHPEIIDQLQPDLVVANKEENVKEQVEAIAERYPVWLTNINDLDDAVAAIQDIGTLTHRGKAAADLNQKIRSAFDALMPPAQPRKTVYLIWREPYITVGGDTFINDMMRRSGFDNMYAVQQRYPTTTIDELKKLQPEILLLSSEPFPFKQKHVDEWQTSLPGTKILLVDGEMFSWYGSRLLRAAEYFSSLH